MIRKTTSPKMNSQTISTETSSGQDQSSFFPTDSSHLQPNTKNENLFQCGNLSSLGVFFNITIGSLRFLSSFVIHIIGQWNMETTI